LSVSYFLPLALSDLLSAFWSEGLFN
jgi:hypothetical protein